MTDITYIRTWQGWLYLAVVMDLFSRLVVGWAAKPTIHRELVLNPDARLYKKATSNEAKRAYLGHPLTEHRHGLIVDTAVTAATGTGERAAANRPSPPRWYTRRIGSGHLP